jgi:hypothetical protein
VWPSLLAAGLIAQASAGGPVLAAADDAGGEPIQPCPPRPGEVVPGPCSPAPPQEPSPPPQQPPIDVDALLEEEEEEPGWIDSRHGVVEESLTAIVHRLDDFFGDPAHYQFDPPSSRIRLRGGVRGSQRDPVRDQLELTGSVLADLRLPALDRLLRRARLFVAGSSDVEERTSGTEQDLVPRRFDPTLKGRGGAVELRFDLFRVRSTVVDMGGGARFGLPPPPYVRVRAAHAEELRLGFVGHVNQTVFWQRAEGFGESSRVDVERVFTPRSVARLWAIATLHERSRGLEWGAESGLQQGLGRRTGVYLAGGLEGATRSNANVDRYRLFTRLRRDVHEGWLFVEVEPEVSWPVTAASERVRVVAGTLRLEVQFSTRRRR